MEAEEISSRATALTILCDGLLKSDSELGLLKSQEQAHISSPSSGQLLHAAAFAGNVREVDCLLKSDPELLHLRDPCGNTPLHVAAFANRITIVARFLVAGADVNAADFRRYTPLHRAVLEGHAEATSLLLQRRASANAPGAEGNTPLHLLALVSADDLRLAELLLAHRAAADATNIFEKTPLDLARARSVAALLSVREPLPLMAMRTLLSPTRRASALAVVGERRLPRAQGSSSAPAARHSRARVLVPLGSSGPAGGEPG